MYNSKEPPEKTAGRYRIRFDGVKKGNEREPDGKYVVKGHGHSGDFYVYPYGEERDRSSWDGKYAHMLAVSYTHLGQRFFGDHHQGEKDGGRTGSQRKRHRRMGTGWLGKVDLYQRRAYLCR